MRSRTLPFVAALLATGGLVWLLAPTGAPPLYDGIGFPDEPYRFVVAPPGYQHTKPPTVARAQFSPQSGTQYVSSAESGPQVSLYLPSGSIAAPRGTRTITVTAAPIAAPGPAFDGVLWGNVYQVSITADGQPVALTPDGASQAQLQMRAPTPQQPGPMFETREGNHWTRSPTTRVGNDIYVTGLHGPGDYALVGAGRLNFSAPDPYNEANVGLTGVVLAASGVFVVVVLFVIGERRRSRRRRARRAARAAPLTAPDP
ncbi:MAG TPA: hypothetical protein VNG13_09480 [Mycobacteriales bacterium]|nr:hypothetical protein [Mycobacteriales bacterium]